MILLISMRVEQLRAKHPVFHYQNFKISQKSGALNVSFDFFLEPDIRFQPRLQIPLTEQINFEEISHLVFNLGLVEAISYWKAACPPVFSVEAGLLNEDQIDWWHDLFIHGLGEFYYRNNIDFTQTNFLTITNRHSEPSEESNPALQDAPLDPSPAKPDQDDMKPAGDLFLVGGGKDSAVTLELTKNLSAHRQVMLLNPNPAMLNVSRLAGFLEPIIVKRALDPKLLELNHQGYLNGHTPFSAYLAFLSLLVGKIYHFKHIIASNEESASVGNTIFHDLEVNHQYSKSFRFEKMFREYYQKYLTDQNIDYFSFLRPLSELQIARLFAGFSQYFTVFDSCNVGRGKYWCGKCPKCAFVFLILSPFISTDNLIKLFSKDLLNEDSLTETFSNLTGVDGFKPFDCIGTKEESIDAVGLTIVKYQKEGRMLPKNLMLLKNKLKIKEPIDSDKIIKKLKSHWSNHNFIPKEYQQKLRNFLYKSS